MSGVGGALLTPESILPSTPAEDKRILGSGMIMEAASIEEVKKTIESDIYYTSGVVRSLCFLVVESAKAMDIVGCRETCHPPYHACASWPAGCMKIITRVQYIMYLVVKPMHTNEAHAPVTIGCGDTA
jgi:hypothetical protein